MYKARIMVGALAAGAALGALPAGAAASADGGGWVSAYFLTGPGNGDDKAVDVNGRTIKTCSKVY
ncbi:hypothetical protein [Spirillospora sp. CA-128828]|uniref:hypothetical protein n=1 Tax=Spirillospora sp. CA-128828 TaxID=3240033 RepID=UPI003D93815C